MRDTVLSLCDYTGNMVKPWLDAGYNAILVDPQHDETGWTEGEGDTGDVFRLAMTIGEALERRILQPWLLTNRIAMVFGFPPCTEFANSGARWFKAKYAADPQFQVKAMVVAEQCRTIGQISNVPYMIENPAGALSSVWGKPNHIFNPYDYTAFEADDNYRKRTCLWTGNGFKMPPASRNPNDPEPDSRIHMAGESKARANFRSATPMGLARAVFASHST